MDNVVADGVNLVRSMLDTVLHVLNGVIDLLMGHGLSPLYLCHPRWIHHG